MTEHYNARTVEVRYRKEPDAQKLLIIDATALEPNEATVVVVMRGDLRDVVMLQRRLKADSNSSLAKVVSVMRSEARDALDALEEQRRDGM